MAFIILKTGVEIGNKEIVDSLKELVKKKIARFAIPTAFLVNTIIIYEPNKKDVNTVCTQNYIRTHTGCIWSPQNPLW